MTRFILNPGYRPAAGEGPVTAKSDAAWRRDAGYSLRWSRRRRWRARRHRLILRLVWLTLAGWALTILAVQLLHANPYSP